MNNDELILNELKSINTRLDGLEQNIATKEEVKALEAGQKTQGAAIERLE